ncbi:hypothetical protein NGB58_26300 [Escherichia coli]|nr:hypothetical protein [Escherichia coli]
MKYTDMKQEVAKFKQTLAVISALASIMCYAPATQAGNWYGSSSGEWYVTIETNNKIGVVVDMSGKVHGHHVADNEYMGGFALKNEGTSELGSGGTAISFDGTWSEGILTLRDEAKKGILILKPKVNGHWEAMGIAPGWYKYKAALAAGAQSQYLEFRALGNQTVVPGKYVLKAYSKYWAE